MKHTKFFILLALLFIIPAGVALADEQVAEGDIVDNDITLIGDNLSIERDSVVNGDVVVFDGEVSVEGTVNGDLVVFGRDLEIADTAVIEGDCVLVGGTQIGSHHLSCQVVPIDEVLGDLSDAIPLDLQFGALQDIPPIFGREPHHAELHDTHDRQPSLWARLAGVAGQSLLFGLLGLGVARFWPEHLERVTATARRKSVASGVVGLLTSIAVPSLIIIVSLLTALLIWVCIGILGIPVVIALSVGLAAATLMGWVAIGAIVGTYLAEMLKLETRTLAIKAGLGTAVLTFALGALNIIPFMPAEFVSLVLSLIGLGAVTLTQFGRKTYPPEPPNSDKIDIVLSTLPEDIK